MISLKQILSEVDNLDKFTIKHPNNQLDVNYKSVKLVKQGEANDYVKYNVMNNGRFAGTLYHNTKDNTWIANGGEANNTFPPKRFSNIVDAKDYITTNSDNKFGGDMAYKSLAGTFQSY
jgi:predicted RNA-binding protein with EMAP domain